MTFFSLVLIAFAMSTDAFAAAVARGASLRQPHFPQALKTGLLFGVVEGCTPLLGWFIGSRTSHLLAQWDHWIAFFLLLGLGLKMIHEGLQAPDTPRPARRGVLMTLLTAIATSLDALVVGLGFAFIQVNIVVAATLIGLATMLMVTLGILIGQRLGALLGKRAEILGGLVLIVVGAVILREHLAGLA